MLKEMLQFGYPFLFEDSFDLSKATAAQLDEKFKAAGAQSTHRRSVSFFMGLAKDAGEPLSPYIQARRRKTANGRKPTARKKAKNQPAGGSPQAGLDGSGVVTTPFKVLFDLLDPNEMDEMEQQAVWTLLQYLKKKGE